MSAEYLTAFASVGTFVVIAVTALAALIQLRHIHAANQLTGALHVTEQFRSERIQAAARYIHETLPQRLTDPAYRAELMAADPDRRTHPELFVADLFEQIGSYVKYGMIDGDQFLDLGGSVVQNMWDGMKEAVALRRFGAGPAMYENFEYLAVLATDFSDKHKAGNYPRGVRRLPIPEAAARDGAAGNPR